MTEYLTVTEVAERERAVDVFMGSVAVAEANKDAAITLSFADAVLLRDEIERLREIEDSYEDALSAAEDRRWD